MDTSGKALSYYPGCSCSRNGIGRHYGFSSLAVLRALGITVSEIEDWNCCGSNLYRVVDEKGSYLLGARNLAKALEMNLPEILILCPACFLSMNRTLTEILANTKVRNEITKKYSILGSPASSRLRIRHVIDFLVNDIGEEAIKNRVKRRLEGLKIAAYYGCQITRPYSYFDDPEFPTSLEKIISWIGGQPVESPLKTKCCGGMLMLTNEEEVLTVIEKIFNSYVREGAECIVTACPLCHLNLEMARTRLGKRISVDKRLPIIYFTQLVGLSFGIGIDELGISKNIAEHLIEKMVLTATV
ncbi:MAG: CoB--CoM heterodisulfide reductase iron-sulfur subunit B family protein [Thaumarchaeota archaeon]|jgi:heterodisulfide reductase subunit B|nr:CoB--CoM heterodisulfide reductase iron-sulfur subunit B family protein [Candidatus Geocrenenecus arthurdayi]